MIAALAGPRAPARRLAARAVAGALATAVLGMLLMLLGSAPALAHAELLESTPSDGAVLGTAPDTVELRFNEPVQVVADAMRLFPGDGTPLALEARAVDTSVMITLPEGLGDGAYALAYRIVSADGHPVGGALTFQVGDGSFTAPDPSEAPGDPVVTETIVSALTVLQYLGLLVFAGLLVFERGIVREPHPGDRRIRVLSRVSFGTALGASLLLIPASGARVSGSEFVSYLPDTGNLVFLPASSWMPGVSWQLIATAIVVLVMGLAALVLDGRARASRAARGAGVLSAAVALATPLLVGHTQTVQPGWAMLAADLGHLFAGAFWTGGVIGLLCVLAAARPEQAGAEPRLPMRLTSQTVSRFSQFALGSVLVLAVSGTVMAFLIVGSWDALFGSTYGRLLIIKLGIVGVVIVLAAWNRLRVLPRIAEDPSEARQWRSLRRVLSGEAILLIAAICVTGFLTNTSPNTAQEAGGAQTAPLTVTATSQEMTVDGVLEPASPGENTLVFRLEYRGEPVTTDEVTVEARLPEEQLGPFTVSAGRDDTSGEYAATLTLPVSGEWQIQVSARIDTYAQPIAVIPVAID